MRTCLLSDFSKVEESSNAGFKFLRVSTSSDKGTVLQLLQGNTLFMVALHNNSIPSDLCTRLFKTPEGACIPIYVADKDCNALKSKLSELGVNEIELHSVYDRFYELYSSELPAEQSRDADSIYRDISTVFSKKYSKLLEEFPNAPNVSDTCETKWDDICKSAPIYCYHCIAIRDIKTQREKPKKADKHNHKVKDRRKDAPHASPEKRSIVVVLHDNDKGSKKRTKNPSNKDAQSNSSIDSSVVSKNFQSADEAKNFAKNLNWEKCMVIEKNSNLDLLELHMMCTTNGSYTSCISDNYIFYGFPRSQEVNMTTFKRSMPDTNMFLVEA